MKFGAIFEDFKAVEVFKRMVAVATRQTNHFIIIRLTSDTVYLITNEGNDAKVLCQASSNTLFSRYIFDGIAADCNETCLQTNGDFLVGILRSVNNNLKSMKLKLFKNRQESFIQVEIEMVTDEIGDIVRVINHNLPVVVISRKYWSEFLPFDIPESDVSIYMPPNQIIRNVIEKMKHWDTYVILVVKSNGETCFKVKRSSNITTKFKPCEVNPEVNPLKDESMVRIDVKRISLYFNNLHVSCLTQCFVTHERCVRFKSMFEETNFQLILPHICE